MPNSGQYNKVPNRIPQQQVEIQQHPPTLGKQAPEERRGGGLPTVQLVHRVQGDGGSERLKPRSEKPQPMGLFSSRTALFVSFEALFS